MKMITPEEISFKSPSEFTIMCFNQLIAKNWSGTSSTIKQDDIINYMLNKDPDLSRATIFSENMLDIEDAYRSVGWTVVYDKPAYSENYEAYFVFKKGSK